MEIFSTPLLVTVILGSVGLAIPIIDSCGKNEAVAIDYIAAFRLAL